MHDIDHTLAAWTAAERDGDAAALDTLLTEEFTAVGPLGFILPKQAWLARHRPDGGLVYDSFGLAEVQTRMLGADVAVVTARNDQPGSYQGNPIPEAVRATLILAREDGRWRLAAAHLSFIAGTAGAPPMPGAGSRPAGAGGPR
jgi:ketosteroid isomerase-like protein